MSTKEDIRPAWIYIVDFFNSTDSFLWIIGIVVVFVLVGVIWIRRST